jgi:tetratricopeptide (TPR) repeat protein
MGLLGFIPYLLIFIIILYYSYYLMKKQEKSEDRWFSILLFASIVGYIFISFSDFPLERIEHQIILFTIFSIIISQYYLINNNQEKIHYSNSKNLSFLFSIATLFIFQMIVISNRFKGELHTNRLFNAQKMKNWDLMINEVDLATNYYYTIDPMSTPLLWYKGVSLFTLEKISEAKIIFEKALKIHPYNIHVLNNLASCYEKLGNHKMAEKNYKKALKISSHF